MQGGSGTTLEDAEILSAPSTTMGVVAEYAFIQQHCGHRNEDWIMKGQTLLADDSGRKHYDVIAVELKNGTERGYYFDLSSFFGKP